MVFRKQAALAMALASVVLMLGCTDELNAPNTTDELPVLPPTNVTAFALTDGHVRVKWDASSEPTISAPRSVASASIRATISCSAAASQSSTFIET